MIGGLLAMAVRWQLAWPWKPMPILSRLLWSDPSHGYQMPPEFYNKLFTMHATIMIFFVIIPLLTGAFGNFLIPLMIGARDMAFPKLNMFSYWFMPPAMILITYSFFVEGGSAEAGWTSYPILTIARWATPGSLNGQTFWLLALLCAGISSLLGSINYITTIVMLRAPGMKMFRMPMTVWAMFITALLASVCPAGPDLGLDHAASGPRGRDELFQPGGLDGGQRTAGGRRRRPDSVPARVLVLLAPGGLRHDPAGDGNGLGHHRHVFAQAALRLQADGFRDRRDRRAGLHRLGPPHVPVGHEPGTRRDVHAVDDDDRAAVGDQGIQLAGHALGGPTSSTPRRCSMRMAFVAMFIIGGLSGIFMAATPVDIHIHDTYFIVGHIHYVLFGGSMFGIFGAIYYWFPKMFGRMMDERLGIIHFILTFIFFNGTFFLMHIVGMHGHPRRIADPNTYLYLQGAGIVGMNQFMTINAFLLGLTQFIFAYNFVHSIFFGPKASENPWHANTLEWATSLSAGALQLRADPDGLPCPLRVQRAGRRGRLSAANPCPGRLRPVRSIRSWREPFASSNGLSMCAAAPSPDCSDSTRSSA